MPKFSQLSERFQRLKCYWEELGGASSSRSGGAGGGAGGAAANLGGSTNRLTGRKFSNPGIGEAHGHLGASSDCISGQYGDSEVPPAPVRAVGSRGARASGRGTVKQGIRKRYEVFEEMSVNGLNSRKGSFSDETKAERAEIFLRYQAEKLQDRSKYKSVFYDRVGPELEDPTIAGAPQVSDDDSASIGSIGGGGVGGGGGGGGGGSDSGKGGSPEVANSKRASSSRRSQGESSNRSGHLAGRLTGSGPGRTLWCSMREVTESGLLETMTKDEIRLQEAQFEIITSEASYLKNLLVLIEVFYKSPLFDHTEHNALVKALDKHHLFSNIDDIYECSTIFLSALEEQWKKSPRMDWISQVILENIDGLKVYKDYCRNFYYQTKTLQKLCANPEFLAQLNELERHPDCRHIAMQSYLEMPMKRVMSLQLLMDAVMRRMPTESPYSSIGMQTLGQLLTLARECDQESRMMSEKEQMLKLQNLLVFNSKVKKVGCWGGGRHLIREGQVRVLSATPNTQGFITKLSLKKNYLQLHAFSDLLIVSKPKSDQGYQVLKHCPRSYVDAEILASTSSSANGGGGGGGGGGMTTSLSTSALAAAAGAAASVLAAATSAGGSLQKQTLRLRLVDSSDGTPEVTLLLELKSREEAEQWMLIFSPRDELGDPVYDQDDCPQAEVIRPYKQQQKDDLELRPGEIVNIYKKTEDGWFLGSRVSQLGFRGWFPGSHVREIENEHYIAKKKKVSFRRRSAAPATGRHRP